jgi:hypothetical protein
VKAGQCSHRVPPSPRGLVPRMPVRDGRPSGKPALAPTCGGSRAASTDAVEHLAAHIDTSEYGSSSPPFRCPTRLGQHGSTKENLRVGQGCRRSRAAVAAPRDPINGVLGLKGTDVVPSQTADVESRNAERVRLMAERDKLRATDPEGLAGAWVMIEGIWSVTVTRARRLPEPVLHEQVNGEWSFVQTHRHLVLATDCWLRRMVKGIARPPGERPHSAAVPARDPQGGVAAPSVRGPGPRCAGETSLLIARHWRAIESVAFVTGIHRGRAPRASSPECSNAEYRTKVILSPTSGHQDTEYPAITSYLGHRRYH